MPEHLSASPFCFSPLCAPACFAVAFLFGLLYSLLWYQVTTRYLGEEWIFSVVLDLPFLQVPMGRGGVTPALIGLV